MGEVYKRGNSWYIDYRVQGKRVRKSIGPDRHMAEIVLKDTEVKIARGTYLDIHEQKQIRFNDLAKRYLAWAEAHHTKSHHGHVRSTLQAHLIPHFHNCYLADITREQVDAYIIRRKKTVTANTINHEIAYLKGILRLAKDWGYHTQDPTQGIKRLKFQSPEFPILNKDDIPRLLAACPPFLYPIVVTALNTGMRRGEIFSLQWKDVDLNARRITVQGEDHTKSFHVRHIPINDFLYEVLRHLPRSPATPYLFPNEHGNKRRRIHHPFQTARNKANLPHLRFHDLRHTFASHLVMAGVDLRTVQQLLGHSDINTTMRYAHLAPGHIKAAVEKLEMGTIWSQAPNHTLKTPPQNPPNQLVQLPLRQPNHLVQLSLDGVLTHSQSP